MSNRIIHSRQAHREVPALLQTVFSGELLAPSRCMWLVSPWLSDIPIMDNTASGFVQLVPNWPRSWISLSRVLGELADRGTEVLVATRPLPHNQAFERELEALGKSRIKVAHAENLHTKGILGDSFHIGGSMNFTHNGLTANEEAVVYTTDASTIAGLKFAYAERWGGPSA